jgi:radical SAM family RiPP maturation amino acid epimerase
MYIPPHNPAETSFDQWLERNRGVCRRILDRDPEDAAYLSEVAGIKRFLERFVADAAFAEALKAAPAQAAREHGFDLDPESIRLLWDFDLAKKHKAEHGVTGPPPVQRYRSFIFEKLTHREQLRLKTCVPIEERHRTWRQRQINRCWTQMGRTRSYSLIHTPLAIEVSKGCSVGCWFCGFSAARKTGDFLYTPENRDLWRGVLQTLGDVIGPAACSTGVCYWATDPLDNPDYESLCLDFADILGKFPQTTTAQPQKHVARLKKLLPLSRQRGCEVNRFSILSLSILEEVFRSFTPEELLHTELITQNIESRLSLSQAGRARRGRRLQDKLQRLALPVDHTEPGTIACVTGFLLNMVDRSVKLIAPCPSNDQWPEGHWIFEQGCFDSPTSLRTLLHGMIERHMSATLRASDPVAFRPDLRFTPLADSIQLTTRYSKTTVSNLPLLPAIGELVAEGTHSAGEIALLAEDRHGLEAARAFDVLNRLFHDGFLNEDPSFFLHKKELAD